MPSITFTIAVRCAPCVAVCIDGSDPSYLARYLSRGELPNIARFIREGFAGTAQSSVPAFTCPNNMSIITGVPVSQHGISGNYYLDTKTWEPVVMTDPKLLMAQTILSGLPMPAPAWSPLLPKTNFAGSSKRISI